MRELPPPNFDEQRGSSRKTLVFVLGRLTAGPREVLCRVRNVSGTGFGIETSIRLKRDDPVTISFPDRQFTGIICWSREPFAGVQTHRDFCADGLVTSYSASADRPKWEHEYLAVLGTQLAHSVSRPTPDPGIDHSRIRQRFSQALRAHLKYEDWAIYPALLRHADPEIAAAAARLQDEMGGLEASHNDYTRRWASNAAQEHWSDYRRETNALVDALMRRLRKEDAQLYGPLTAAQ